MGLDSKRLVCVTGASGFVASWLVKRLLAHGYHVRGTVRDPGNTARTAHLWALPGAQERLELLPADLLTHGSFDSAVDGCEGVFHTATPVTLVKSDPKVEIIDPAVNGTLNVLQSCKNSKSVKRVVLTASSASVRFRDDVNPDVQLDDSSWSSLELCYKFKMWYAVAKILAERAAWEFAAKNGMDLVVLLPSFVVGPVLPPDLSSTASDVLGLLTGESSKFALHGRMGYVHIDDVATAHILAYEEPSAKGRLVCSAVVLDVEELAKFLADRYPDLNIALQFESYGERPRYFLDSSKLERLGLRFKSLEEMFDDCVASFRAKGLL